LPLNFNSPYKALDIQEFWRRWHITLSRFLRDYLYIPLGGNRGSTGRIYLNIMATFVLGGLWHGASWIFVVWGALHGVAIITLRIWRSLRRPMPAAIAWLVTFLFVNTSWVFFRADTWGDAERVLRGMIDVDSALGMSIASIPTAGLAWGGFLSDRLLQVLPNGFVPYIASYAMISIAFVVIWQKNAFELMSGEFSWEKVAAGAAVFSVATYFTLVSSSSVFLYFNF